MAPSFTPTTPAGGAVAPADPADPPVSPPRWAPWVVVWAMVVAAVLVAWQVGDKSFWIDEGHSFRLVNRPLPDVLWRITHWELNQGPYHLLLAVWARVFDSDGGLRLLSGVFVVATVPVLYATGRRLVGASAAAIACLLLATNSLVVEWGQQVRGYSLALLLTTASCLLLLRALERPTLTRIVLYGVVSGLGVYTHFFVALVVVAQLLTLAVVKPVPRRVLIGAAVTVGLIAAPAGLYVATASGDPLRWVSRPDLAGLVEQLGLLAGGKRPALLLVGVVALVGIVVAVRRILPDPRSLESWRLVFLIAWLVVPVVATLAVTYTVKPLFVARFLIVIEPALALLVAYGVVNLPARWLSAVALVALLLLPVRYLTIWYDKVGEDWRAAVAEVQAEAQPGDVAVIVPLFASEGAYRYGLDRSSMPPVVAADAPDLGTTGRVWVLDYKVRNDRTGEQRLINERMADGYRLLQQDDHVAIIVSLYEPVG